MGKINMCPFSLLSKGQESLMIITNITMFAVILIEKGQFFNLCEKGHTDTIK
jgi:hypothetical protein